MDAGQQKGADIARMIWIVATPIIFTVGVFGNIMTIIVLTGKRNKKTSTTIFLTFLAVADLIIMTIMLPRWWLIYLFGFDIRHFHNLICKIQFFANYFGSAWSSSLLATVTVERTICTVKPYRVKEICNVHVAITISLFLALTLIVIHGHILLGINLHEVTFIETSETRNSLFLNNSIVQPNCEGMLDQLFDTNNDAIGTYIFEDCNNFFDSNRTEWTNVSFPNVSPKDESNDVSIIKVCWYDDLRYGQYFSGVHQIVATVCYFVIPETIFLVGGLIIARSLQQSKKLRLGMRSKYMQTLGYKPAFDNRASQITLSLILVNIVFVFTSSPALCFLMLRASVVDEETGMTSTQEIVWAIVNMMLYTNHSINFVLYFLSGYRFRRQVIETFCFRQSRNIANSKGSSDNQCRVSSVSPSESHDFK